MLGRWPVRFALELLCFKGVLAVVIDFHVPLVHLSKDVNEVLPVSVYDHILCLGVDLSVYLFEGLSQQDVPG